MDYERTPRRTVPPPYGRNLRHFFRTWRRKISEGTLGPEEAVELGPRVIHRKLLARVPPLPEERRIKWTVEARGLVVRLVPFSLSETVRAQLVVGAALLCIRQHGVGRANALELFFVAALVGMRL